MIHERLVTTLAGLMLLGGTLLPSCGGRTEDHATDTKTNWLASCEANDECDDGLMCLCGVCTIGCATSDLCEKFGDGAACFHAECASDKGVCALPETPLESSVSHVEDDAGSDDECPRPAESYAALGAECAGVVDCIEGVVRFDDECGCGCELNAACDPTLEYVAYGSRCETIDYDCLAGEEHFTDECGCGCQSSETTPECPREADEYTLLGALCDSAAVDCSAGFEYFRDDCGCGCEPSEISPECPRESNAYTLIGEQCDQADFDCVPESEYFRDECGCGCEINPACDPDVDYILFGTCEGADFECDAWETGVSDECGCGCKRNPDCDPDVEYVVPPGSCTLSEIACDEAERVVSDDCGCGCKATNDGADGGTETNACLPPDGVNLETTLLFQTTCSEFADVHQVVGSQEEWDQVMAQCVAQADVAPEFSGPPLYITTVPDRDSARHLYTVETDDGIQLGMEYDAYCGGARPPTLLFVFQIAGITSESTVAEGVCMSGECTGLPPP